MKGKTKFFNPKKGFGFIIGEDDKEYFVHQSELQMEGFRMLKGNQRATFDVVTEDGKTRAVNVKPL